MGNVGSVRHSRGPGRAEAGRENPRGDPEAEQGTAEVPGQGKRGLVTWAPMAPGCPSEAGLASGHLGPAPHGPPLACLPSASLSDSWLVRVVHQIDYRRQVPLVRSGSLWSQAARPPRKPQTGPRPPAHTHPPAPTYATNELGFGPQNHNPPQPDRLAPAGLGEWWVCSGSHGAEPPEWTAPLARPCRAGERRCLPSWVLMAQGQVTTTRREEP